MKSAKKAKKAKKRLGRVMISISYVVDLDNRDMVNEAKDCLYEDMCNCIKYDEIASNIVVAPDKKLKESDIPDFLLSESSSDD